MLCKRKGSKVSPLQQDDIDTAGKFGINYLKPVVDSSQFKLYNHVRVTVILKRNSPDVSSGIVC